MILLLKRYKWENTAQFLSNLVLMCYVFIISYTTYETKLNMNFWKYDVNYVRMWLYIESVFFIAWLVGSAIFVIFAYIFKLRSSVVDEIVEKENDDIWSDRATDDFLRYIKFDYYVLTLNIACFCMDITVMFSPVGVIPTMGPRSFWPSEVIIIITLL